MISGNEFTIQITWSGISEGSRWLTLQPLDVVRETLEETLTSAPVAACSLVASTLVGAERRAFQATMVLQACDSKTRFAESRFGWGRATVQLGLAAQRCGVRCVGAPAG